MSDTVEWDPPWEFFEQCAKYCRCCRVCGDVPCAATMAGGLCDEARCSCDDWNSDDHGDDPDLDNGGVPK